MPELDLHQIYRITGLYLMAEALRTNVELILQENRLLVFAIAAYPSPCVVIC
jgi:hypothetical protein